MGGHIMLVQTVSEAWQFYKKFVLNAEGSPKCSLSADESRWKRHIDPVLGARRIDSLVKADYLMLRNSVEDKSLSPQTVRHVITLLRRVLNSVVEWEVYQGKDHPSFQKILPKFDNMRQRFLSRDEAKQLFSLLEPYENWHDISMISINTGLRLGEILRISMCHVNFNQRLLTVIDTKSRKNRIVPLNNSALSILTKKNFSQKFR